MISAEDFLAMLAERDLLPRELLAEICNKVAQSPQQITAAELSQMLIDMGYFTPALANHFLGEATKHTVPHVSTPEKQEEEEELGFAQVKEERQPRILRGNLRAYKLEEKEKEQSHKPKDSDASKPQESSVLPPKKTLLDKPPASPWSTSVYERETDSYKGLVSYRLAKLAESEARNPPLPLPSRRDWSLPWIAVWGGLFLLLLMCLLFWVLFR